MLMVEQIRTQAPPQKFRLKLHRDQTRHEDHCVDGRAFFRSDALEWVIKFLVKI